MCLRKDGTDMRKKEADDDNSEEYDSSLASFVGTHSAFAITFKVSARNTIFLNLIDPFQFASGLFGMNGRDKTQFCCLFYPLLRSLYGKYYDLPETTRTLVNLCQCCHFTDSWQNQNCYFDIFIDLKNHIN